jgi:hypothetical protein
MVDESNSIMQDANAMPDRTSNISTSTNALLEVTRGHFKLDTKASGLRLTSQQWTSSNPPLSASTPNR